MSVPDNLCPTHREKTTRGMKAPYAVKHITFTPSEANPGETLNVHVPKLNKNEVLVPGQLVLCFDIDLSGGHASNFLMQNVSQAGSEVWGHDLRRHGGPQRIQDIQ